MSLPNSQADLIDSILEDSENNSPVSPAANLKIYRNNIYANFRNHLKEVFPLIIKLVGEDFFDMAAIEYINRYPSRSGNLHDVGAYFSDFIAEFTPAKDYIYLSEVAKFEWACHSLYFAADASAFDVHKLQNFNVDEYDQLHFAINPACVLMRFEFPLLKIIDLCDHPSNDSINLDEGGVYLQIIRRNYEIKLVELSDADDAFLTALLDNQSLHEAHESALLFDPNYPLQEKLMNWFKDETIVDCYIAN